MSLGARLFIQSAWKPLKKNFTDIVEALKRGVQLADADFNLTAVESQERERKEQRQERLKQEVERTHNGATRIKQEAEFQLAEDERKLQAQERAKVQAERARFEKRRQSNEEEKKDEARHKLMKWLSRSDPVPAYLKTLAKQSENPLSCEWIFRTTEYQQWHDDGRSKSCALDTLRPWYRQDSSSRPYYP